MRYKISKVETRLCLKEAGALYSAKPITSVDDAVDLLRSDMKTFDREETIVLNLDRKNRPINYHVASIGTLTTSVFSMQNLFKTAILSNADRILLLHNHPSGDPTPSDYDYEVTKQVRDAGKILGFNLVDHIVVGRNRYFSFFENTNILNKEEK